MWLVNAIVVQSLRWNNEMHMLNNILPESCTDSSSLMSWMRISSRWITRRRITLNLRRRGISIRWRPISWLWQLSGWRRNWLVDPRHLLHWRHDHSRSLPKLTISLVHFNLVLGLDTIQKWETKQSNSLAESSWHIEYWDGNIWPLKMTRSFRTRMLDCYPMIQLPFVRIGMEKDSQRGGW